MRYGARIKTATTMKSYVDTCFLMLEPGRRHLLASGMKFTVIEAVRNELTRLADKDKNVKAAQEALEFMQTHADLFEMSAPMPEELGMRISLREGSQLTADSVFRRIAIRCADEQTPVHFLTADWALAEALGLYATKITYLYREEEKICDWREHRTAVIRHAQDELAVLMAESDVVLSSSGLQSPFLRQFLQNLQSLGIEKSSRPILHSSSLDKVALLGHLPLEIVNMLEENEVVRHCGGEPRYLSETAMLDALFYARTLGRRITVVVSGWHDVVQRYDARSHGAESGVDAVNFRVISPAGGLVPLLKGWRLRVYQKPELITFPMAPGVASAPQPESETQVEECAPLEDEHIPMETVLKDIGSRLAQLVKDEHEWAVRSLIGSSRKRMALAVGYALRWGKKALLQTLVSEARDLPAYCFDNWFKKSPHNANLISDEQLLADDVYYKQLRCVLRNSEELSPDSPAIKILLQLVKSSEKTVSDRARAVLKMLAARGVNPPPPAPELVSPSPVVDCATVDQKYNHLFHQQMARMSMMEFLAEIKKSFRAEEFPAVLPVAIKVARRRNKPGLVTALLNLSGESLSPYCFQNWFAYSKTAADSPRARDLMLRKVFFDQTKRIIRLTPDLSMCRPAMQVLLTLEQDADETVRVRAAQLRALAAAKGAPVPGKTDSAA